MHLHYPPSGFVHAQRTLKKRGSTCKTITASFYTGVSYKLSKSFESFRDGSPWLQIFKIRSNTPLASAAETKTHLYYKLYDLEITPIRTCLIFPALHLYRKQFTRSHSAEVPMCCMREDSSTAILSCCDQYLYLLGAPAGIGIAKLQISTTC